jgi:DNA-binding winged helix-turn-helix (wHTH) protein/TolB-like protein/Flp pilus assembly protein TadD
MISQTLDAGTLSPSPSRVRIGEWWADRTTNELGRPGTTLRIEPKAMEVLMVLADHAGRAVSRDHLLSTVWPGVVVGDEVLTQSIIKLRRALGDNPRAPSYIETISKRGYRLVAPVGTSEDAGVQAARAGLELATPEQPSASTRSRGLSSSLIAGATIALVAVAVFFYNIVSQPSVNTDPVDVVGEPQSAWVTVSVLPFEWLGSDASQAYLARGISNDLVTDISRLAGVSLVTASGAKPTTQNARYRISGSVQRESETLRINVHLIDTRTNQELWSERFERPYADLFAVQSEITHRVTAALPGAISDSVRKEIAKRYTRNLEAYDNFVHGQALFLVRQSELNDKARAFYRKAVELDPTFARAYAGLAMTYAMDYRLRPSGDASPALDRAREFAETASLIDPDIPEVYWALAFVYAQSRRHEQAIEFLQKAIELNPSFADAYAFMGGLYTYMGESAKSIPLLRKAMRLNPEGGYLYFLLLGRAYLFQNDIEQALINLREAWMRNPDDLETRLYLAAAMVGAGDRAGAVWEAEEIRSADADFSLHGWLETYPLRDSRYKARLEQLLATVGL